MVDATQAVNAAVRDAQSLPALVAQLRVVEPGLAAQIEGKPLIQSKTPAGVVLVAAVTYLSSRYGLGWDADTCALVGGAATLVAGYIFRLLSSHPITSIVRRSP